MAALAWLLIPLVAAVAASLWGSWVGRRRARTPDAAGVAGYERFRAAMERSGTDAPTHLGTESSDVPAAHADAVNAEAANSDAASADAAHTDAPTADVVDAAEARRSARWRRRKKDAEFASAGAPAHANPDGPAREAG
ncbi:hypothetical protein ACTWQF_02355 [Streptomyces sp. 8N114]|uniref:hypothetical protein n=1 Tax=Streptomyces sp. 8N114 TaxID=3457419 RepID=UPI003FD5B105